MTISEEIDTVVAKFHLLSTSHWTYNVLWLLSTSVNFFMQQYMWTVRVSSVGNAANAFVRKHDFTVGDAIHFDEEYPHITALEFVLGAIGADVVNGLRSLARKRRVEIDHVEANVQAELNNPLTFLGVVGEAGHPGLERVQVKIYVSSLSPRDELESVWNEMIERSPLIQTFRSAIDLELTWKVIL